MASGSWPVRIRSIDPALDFIFSRACTVLEAAPSPTAYQRVHDAGHLPLLEEVISPGEKSLAGVVIPMKVGPDDGQREIDSAA